MILDVQQITKHFGETCLFENVSFHLENHEKAALVGINGAGKSTLLKIILSEMDADSGRVVFEKDASIGYLSQNPMIESDKSIMDELLTVKAHVLETELAMRSSEHQMKHLQGEALEAELSRYARLTELFEREGGYQLKSEAIGVLKGLGFTEDEFTKKASVLSGGQRTRLAMGRLLLSAPDLLFLDEPTNHLDLNAIIWLETYLQNYKGAVLLVSHDRYFLNKIVSKVVELDNRKAFVYAGTFDDYNVKKEARLKAAYAAYVKAETERHHQEAVIKKLQSFNREKSIKRAESRKKVLDKMDMPEKPSTDTADMRLKLTPGIESGSDVMILEDVSKAFGSQELFAHVDAEIFRGERVLLIGGNGTGKSTLLKILNDRLPMDNGHIRFGTNVHIGYYDQEMQNLHDDKTIFQEISDAYPTLNNTKIRSVLAAFLFTGDDVFKTIDLLSGGERARVSLAKLMLSEANFLMLDEPTNHLDIQSKEILENALRSYEGTVLCVSHDRYFINQVATRILDLSDRKIMSYPGNYDDYLHTKEKLAAIENMKASADTSSDRSSDSKTTAASDAKSDWLTQKAEEAQKRKKASDLKKTEDRIASLEAESEEIAASLSDPEVATNVSECIRLTDRQSKIETELEALYETWEKLAE